jgi:hypothetical protein
MSKVLVITYSYTGTCRQLAQLLCSQQGWPMGEISDVRSRKGMMGLWRSIVDSWLHRRPAISYVGPPPIAFDAVVLVSPIWAYRLASPMRSFVAARHGELRNVAVISAMGNRGAPNAVAEISRLLGRSPILDTAFTTRQIEDGSCATLLQAFGTAVDAALGQQDVVRPAVWSPQAV